MTYFGIPDPVNISPGGGAGDAFGRLRVSNPTTLFDSKQIFDNQPLIWDDAEVSGGGTGSSYSQTAFGATANTVTSGTRITSGLFESGGNAAGSAGSVGDKLENALRLGAAIDGTMDEMVLTVMPIGGSTSVDVEGSVSWREIT